MTPDLKSQLKIETSNHIVVSSKATASNRAIPYEPMGKVFIQTTTNDFRSGYFFKYMNIPNFLLFTNNTEHEEPNVL